MRTLLINPKPVDPHAPISSTPIMGDHLTSIFAEAIDGITESNQPLVDLVHVWPALSWEIAVKLGLIIPELRLILIDLSNHHIFTTPNPNKHLPRTPTLNLSEPLIKPQELPLNLRTRLPLRSRSP